MQRRHAVWAVLYRLIEVTQVRADPLCVNRPRGYSVDPDAVLRQLQRHVPDKTMHASLRRRVGRAAIVVSGPGRALAGARGDTHDAAGALPHHVWHGVPRTQERTAEVETQDKVPVCHRHLPDLRRAAPADVVDQNVETPKALQ